MPERIVTTADLTWDGDLRFIARSGAQEIVVDSNGERGPSPMQTLAMSLAGCMAIDLVDILRKGRHEVRALRARFSAPRALEPPKRFEEIALHYVIEGNAPASAIERAIALSREKYCSVWHSMRHDIDFRITYDARP
ncbi:MAG TPA: OsmC family protein [Vicinamibacterales bacterium]|nr:OsmC family protein [Vicinamibacterales bacterium]